jgi:hypothetical protein
MTKHLVCSSSRLSILLNLVLGASAIMAAESATLLKPAALTDAELVTRATSEFFASELDAHRREELGKMQRVVADMNRHLHLDRDRTKHLEIAAAGAVERAMRSWKTSMDKQLRDRTKDVPASKICSELVNIRGNSIADRSATENKVWITAVEDTLTAEEKAKWSAVEGERIAQRQQAILELMLTELQLSISLSDGQLQSLRPLAAKAVDDYFKDFNSIYGNRGEANQPINQLSMYLKAIPESQAKAIITPAQWDHWTKDLGDFVSGWEMVEKEHNRRVKHEAEVAKKKANETKPSFP